MVKTKKARLRKKYQYRNNKALKKRKLKQPKPNCSVIRNHLDKNLPITKNMKRMGLVLNPNKSLKIEKFSDRKINEIAPFLPEDVTILNAPKKKKNKNKTKKTTVVTELEQQCKEKKLKNHKNHVLKLPNEMCKWLMYLIDKHVDDYEAMARDKQNIYQHTPAQIRAQIARFKKTTYQYSTYLDVKKAEAQVMDIDQV